MVLSNSILICPAAQDVPVMQIVLEIIKILLVYKAIGPRIIISVFKIKIACLHVIITLVPAAKIIRV